jgi:putative membrane protein
MASPKLCRATLAVAPVLLLSLAAGCNRRPSSATATGTAEQPRQTPDTTTRDSSLGASGSDTARADSTGVEIWRDPNVVSLLDEANMSDSAAGAYAAPKAVSSDVKAFARLMMSEHHALRVQGQQLAKRLNLTPVPLENDPVRTLALTEMAALQGATKMSGFDSTYIDQEIQAHKIVLDVASRAQAAAQSPDLKKLIGQAKPVIQKHLDRAQAIQKKLRSST